MDPAVRGQGGEPIGVIRGVDRTASLMVARTGSSCQTDAADTLGVPVVQQVLLRGGAEGRVKSDVVVLGFGRSRQLVSCRALQLVNARARAANPRRIQGLRVISVRVSVRVIREIY